jgi:hypothetical protein
MLGLESEYCKDWAGLEDMADAVRGRSLSGTEYILLCTLLAVCPLLVDISTVCGLALGELGITNVEVVVVSTVCALEIDELGSAYVEVATVLYDS